ncbi:hypothetical protein CES85_3396 (plasmid) [Ochrobactrum quorumnocens]|uniref:Uncharacterized protein n=1 Tax=Ochrobactrum quorumnocens TaxID=271865 RepID=A0A248UME9_9HYPH|nr:hypothetical protein CES85_3396 [[Ochrobactrum] quorumnocens]
MIPKISRSHIAALREDLCLHAFLDVKMQDHGAFLRFAGSASEVLHGCLQRSKTQ